MSIFPTLQQHTFKQIPISMDVGTCTDLDYGKINLQKANVNSAQLLPKAVGILLAHHIIYDSMTHHPDNIVSACDYLLKDPAALRPIENPVSLSCMSPLIWVPVMSDEELLQKSQCMTETFSNVTLLYVKILKALTWCNIKNNEELIMYALDFAKERYDKLMFTTFQLVNAKKHTTAPIDDLMCGNDSLNNLAIAVHVMLSNLTPVTILHDVTHHCNVEVAVCVGEMLGAIHGDDWIPKEWLPSLSTMHRINYYASQLVAMNVN